MIELVILHNGAVVRMQRLLAPSVYLDHLGYVTFVQDRDLAERFTGTLQ